MDARTRKFLPDLESDVWLAVAKFLDSNKAKGGDYTKFAKYFKVQNKSAISSAMKKWRQISRKTDVIGMGGAGPSLGAAPPRHSRSLSLAAGGG